MIFDLNTPSVSFPEKDASWVEEGDEEEEEDQEEEKVEAVALFTPAAVQLQLSHFHSCPGPLVSFRGPDARDRGEAEPECE